MALLEVDRVSAAYGAFRALFEVSLRAVIYLNLLRIQPDAAFSVNWTAFMIFIVIIGGVGTIEGPIVGAIVFYLLQQSLSHYGAWYLVLLGLVAVVVTLATRRGLWGLVADRLGVSFFPVERRLVTDRRTRAASGTEGEG